MSTVNYYTAFVLTNLNEPLYPSDPSDQEAYELNRGSLYKVRIVNNHPSLRCDATVNIDGKDIGTYRLKPSSMCTLESTSKVSMEDNLGKVKIIFAQEEEP